MPQIGVFALKTTSGQDKDVNLKCVLEDKLLLEHNVFAQLEEIGMEHVAWNVLMAKFGKKPLCHVFVLMDINGMDNFVIEHLTVLEIEFGTKLLNNVSVPLLNTGMEDNVQLDLFVVEEEFGIQKPMNVIVDLDGNGIQEHVLDVEMVKFGMNLHYNVYALEELYGMEQIVELFNNVEMDKFGILIFGNVNVQIILKIMEFIVSQILAKMEESGATNINHVFVQTTRSGIQELVFLLESIVQMVEFGIQQSMLVFVQSELSLTLINVIQSQHAEMVKSIIL